MRILSWGSNSHGQLSQGYQSEQTISPTEIKFRGDVKQITAGGKHSVILLLNGALYSCGDNDNGQLGREASEKNFLFHVIPITIKIKKISCGWDFNLAVSENLEVFGWGSNAFGQLGLQQKNIKFITSPLKIFGGQSIDICAGLRHSAIVTADGSIFTSGSCRKGQLGFKISDLHPVKFVDKFTQVPGVDSVMKISCGENHCLALTDSSKIYVWGDNKFGQLGLDPARTFTLAPTLLVTNIQENIKDIFSGWSHNAILTESGKILSWGRADYGQLGEERITPWKAEVIKNIPIMKQLVVGSHHNVAVSSDNTVYCWGWNEHGNCGNESLENVSRPVKAAVIEDNVETFIIGTGAAHSFLCYK